MCAFRLLELCQVAESRFLELVLPLLWNPRPLKERLHLKVLLLRLLARNDRPTIKTLALLRLPLAHLLLIQRSINSSIRSLKGMQLKLTHEIILILDPILIELFCLILVLRFEVRILRHLVGLELVAELLCKILGSFESVDVPDN